MDFGRFRHSRTALVVWLVAPLLLAAAVHYASHVYGKSMQIALDRQRQHLAIARDLKLKIDEADAVVTSFQGAVPEGPGRAETVEARLQEAARKAELQITSLALKTREKSDDGNMEHGVSGTGSLPAIVRFLEEAELPSALTTVKTGIILAKTRTAYSCELTIIHHGIGNM